MQKNHPYQIIDPSPWPLLASMGTLLLAIAGALVMHGHEKWLLVPGGLMTVLSAAWWWRDMIVESNQKGIYTKKVQGGLRIGIVLFIISEVLFFAVFFGSYFYASWSEAWPPKDIVPLDPFHLPYLNTLILLLSGTTVTWAHHELLAGRNKDALKGLLFTVALGVTFTCMQAYEYVHTSFGIKDGVYGSNFYMATGFHGAHVIIGTIFLAVCAYRVWKNDLTAKAHIGFEAAAWYWHFVDVVWLFLFVSIYIGSAR